MCFKSAQQWGQAKARKIFLNRDDEQINDECDWDGNPTATITLSTYGEERQQTLEGADLNVTPKVIECAKCPIGQEVKDDGETDKLMKEELDNQDLGDEDDDEDEGDDQEW